MRKLCDGSPGETTRMIGEEEEVDEEDESRKEMGK
jgi:hypothetical protein